MKSRTTKLLVVWNIVLSTLVLVLLGLYASAAQAAADPPVKAFQANTDHNGGRGTNSTEKISVTHGNKWTLIQKLSVDLSGTHNHECAVTANSRAYNEPGNTEDNKYEFVLTLDDSNPSTNLATTRTIDFDNGRVFYDHDDTAVTSSALYHATNEPHTFYWFARKLSDDANPPSHMTIENSTLWAVCVKKLL